VPKKKILRRPAATFDEAGKNSSARRLMHAMVAIGITLTLFSIAPPGSAQNVTTPCTTTSLCLDNVYFITGDYLAGGVGLRGLGVNGFATSTISILDKVQTQHTGVPSPGVPAVATLGEPPSGLIAIKGVVMPGPLDQRTVNHPLVSGIAKQFYWRDLEPVRGKPDWSQLDALFGAAESAKKWVRLDIYPGMSSPPWALEGAKVERFARQYGVGTGNIETLPMPWDPVYLNNWFEFLKLVADRYGRSPAFRLIAAAGPTSMTSESTLPHNPGDLPKWMAAGYTPRRYIEAWRQTFRTYTALFPGQYVNWSIGGGVNINDEGRTDSSATKRTRKALIDVAAEILGRRFVPMCNDLHVGPQRQEVTDLVRELSGRFVTGLEMQCRVSPPGTCAGGAMGAPGDPPRGFTNALDRAFRPTASGKHISFLEIYEGDYLAPEMQGVLRDAAARIGRP
jgi:hypothetical protein